MLQCGQNGFSRRLDRTHQLHHDVDIVAGDQFLDIVGQHPDGHSPVIGYLAHRNTAKFQRRTDTRRQVCRTLVDDPHHFATDVSQTKHGDTYGLVVGHERTSRLSRSSTVSLRSTRRARPARTATTAGRPIRLYRLDIE